eukprot:2293840-Rhodomonas_salina.1
MEEGRGSSCWVLRKREKREESTGRDGGREGGSWELRRRERKEKRGEREWGFGVKTEGEGGSRGEREGWRGSLTFR